MSDGEVGVWRKAGKVPPEFDHGDQGTRKWEPQPDPDWNRWNQGDKKPKRRSWWPFARKRQGSTRSR